MQSKNQSRLASWLRSDGPSIAHVPDDTQTWIELTREVVDAGLSGLMLERAEQRWITIPPIAKSHLRQAAMSVASQNLHHAGELHRILAATHAAGVEVMLLKGAALIPTLYKNPELRPMSDIDLLVRPASVDAAMRVLKSLGYRSGQPLLREDFFPRFYYETELILSSARPVRVDLHARPLRPLPIAQSMPDDALWHDARTLRIGDQTAWIPNPENMFLHLAAHAAFHGCDRLLWLCDLKRFAEAHALDWYALILRAKQWRILGAVRWAVVAATNAIGEICPTAIMDELAAHRPTWRERWILTQAPRDAASPIAHVLCNVVCSTGWRHRLAYLRAVLLPGKTHLAGAYTKRHPGWTAVAMTRRAVRAAARMLLFPFLFAARTVRG